MKPKLSIAMIVCNESRCLARCLQSVREFADEIVVTDTGSTDDTVRIAREFGATVSHFKWIDDFAAARNFALDRCSGDWIFSIDADEWVSDALVMEILSFVLVKPAIGHIKIVSDFRRNGQTFRSHSFVARLFPRGTLYEGRIHEQITSTLPRFLLRGELWHDGYVDTSGKTARNMKLLAMELERNPASVYYLYQMAIEYNSVGQREKAFGCLADAFARARPEDVLFPNIAVDFLYTVMALGKFETGLEVVARGEKFLANFPDFYLARGLFFMRLVRSNPAKYISELPKIEQSFLHCLALGEDESRRSVHGSGTFLANYNLGLYYQAFGDPHRASRCFATAAEQGYSPAGARL